MHQNSISERYLQSGWSQPNPTQSLCMPDYSLDDLDRRVLAELARNGRLTNTELAERVPLSHSAISRRIARLESRSAPSSACAGIQPSPLKGWVGVSGRFPKSPAAGSSPGSTISFSMSARATWTRFRTFCSITSRRWRPSASSCSPMSRRRQVSREVLTDIIDTKRSLRLELIIVALIAGELVIAGYQIL